MSLDALIAYFAWSSKRDKLRKLLRQTIESEGGQVTRIVSIGLLINNPFPLSVNPIYLRVDCSYPRHRGRWLVCEQHDGRVVWIWQPSNTQLDPPGERAEEIVVDSRAITFPRWLNFVILVAAICAGVLMDDLGSERI